MELTIRITDPADMTRFGGLLASFLGDAQTSPLTPQTAKSSRGTKASPVQTVEVPTPEALTVLPTEATTSTVSEVTHEQVRAVATAKMQADAANKTTIKELVAEMGGTAISNVPENRLAELLEKISAL